MRLKTIGLIAGAALALAACSSDWATDYDQGLSPTVTRGWNVTNVVVQVPSTLTVSNANTFAPDANIVWHGDPPGDRRAQVAAIMKTGLEAGAQPLNGSRPVTLVVALQNFHGVTPASISQAPSAVHNISYQIQVQDSRSGEVLVQPQEIFADLEAFTGAAAVVAVQQGQTQKVRVTEHLARVTRSWLGIGPDVRRSFGGFGR